VLGEALILGVGGAAGGVGLAYVLARLPDLAGILHPDYTAGVPGAVHRGWGRSARRAVPGGARRPPRPSGGAAP